MLYFNEMKSRDRDDIVRSVKALRHLGNGYSILEVDGKKFIQSVPREANTDFLKIIQLLQEKDFVTKELVQRHHGWEENRADQALVIHFSVWESFQFYNYTLRILGCKFP
jgi:hypothetical protein